MTSLQNNDLQADEFRANSFSVFHVANAANEFYDQITTLFTGWEY